MLLKGNVKNACSSFLFFELTNCFFFLDSFAQINCNSWSFDFISSLWLGDIHSVNVILLSFKGFSFRLRKLNVENKFACHFLDFIKVFHLKSTDLNELQVILGEPFLNNLFFIDRQLLNSFQISLVKSNNNRLIFEQRLDRIVQMNLLNNRVSTLFRRINKVNNTTLQMSQSSNRLHFNCIHFIQTVIKNSR